MVIRLSDEARRYLAAFAEITDADATDCLVDDELVIVVEPDDMGRAIGPNGETVQAVEERVGRPVILVEDADHPDVFVANALAPAAVYGVDVEEREDETVAVADVDPADVGVAIGEDGQRIDRARALAARHFGIDEIEIRHAEA